MENYPGFKDGISGIDLTQAMYQQATKFGLETLYDEVTGIEVKGREKIVKTPQGDFTAGAVIIAGGSERQKLGVPGEAKYTGKGRFLLRHLRRRFFPRENGSGHRRGQRGGDGSTGAHQIRRSKYI